MSSLLRRLCAICKVNLYAVVLRSSGTLGVALLSVTSSLTESASAVLKTLKHEPGLTTANDMKQCLQRCLRVLGTVDATELSLYTGIPINSE